MKSKITQLEAYSGEDLGAVWTPGSTRFRVWAPTARAVRLNLYKSGDPGRDDLLDRVDMVPSGQGTWCARVEGDLNGIYYTYSAVFSRRTLEACDPYARAVGLNGERAMVMDPNSTNPPGWSDDKAPNGLRPITDAVICEVHLRDLSAHPSSGIREKGRYAALTEVGTTTKKGIPTGIDHIRQLGVTHVQLMPIFDFGSVDEARPESGQYNWGYDPVNFNAPEGSYSADPRHGQVRVREVKEMVMGLHRLGLGVIMDVVYNHVYDAEKFCFNRLVPGYFSRQKTDGSLTDDSGCGNDTASERPMVRKFIVDSLCYWAEEYHLDGFRLDLAGLIDVQTIRQAMAAVRERCPHVIFYGEGWDMCRAPHLRETPMAIQANASQLPGFGFFNDRIRDGLRGSVFFPEEQGFVTGGLVEPENLLDWYCGDGQSINYVSCHDNHTLFDRIATGAPGASFAERVDRNELAAAFVLTARGVPFFLAGEEMLRTKPDGKGGFDHNSYCSGDPVNAIKWDTLENPEYAAVCSFYRGLIAFRKSHPAFRAGDRGEVEILDTPGESCVAFRVGKDAIAIFNAGKESVTLPLPPGQWEVLVDRHRAGNTPFARCTGEVTVAPISPKILIRKENAGIL